MSLADELLADLDDDADEDEFQEGKLVEKAVLSDEGEKNQFVNSNKADFVQNFNEALFLISS